MRNLDDIKTNLNNIIADIDKKYGNGHVQSYLEISNNEFSELKGVRNASFDLVMYSIYKMGFNIDSLEEGITDVQCIENKMNNQKYIPQKYLKGANSKLKVTQNVLKEIKNSYGKHYYDELLSYLQISPEYLDKKNAEECVSTNLNADIYKYVIKYLNGTSKSLDRIGLRMFEYYKNTAFGNAFKGLTAKDTYEKFLTEVLNHIENSYDYRLMKLTNEKAVFEKRLKEEIKDELKVNSYGSSEVCDFSAGFCSSILCHSQNKPAETVKTKCLYSGDSSYGEFVAYFDQGRLAASF